MLRGCENTSLLVTIARWDSHAAWKAFWGNSNPREMQKMRELGERVSVEVLEEIEDCTR